jgi:hypothetical protein
LLLILAAELIVTLASLGPMLVPSISDAAWDRSHLNWGSVAFGSLGLTEVVMPSRKRIELLIHFARLLKPIGEAISRQTSSIVRSLWYTMFAQEMIAT